RPPPSRARRPTRGAVLSSWLTCVVAIVLGVQNEGPPGFPGGPSEKRPKRTLEGDLRLDANLTTTLEVLRGLVERVVLQVAAAGDVVGHDLLVVVSALLIEHRRRPLVECQSDI